MALFVFVFLGSEYHFDIAYGELAGPDSVVGAQASILATSAIGLVGYSLVNRTAAARHRSILAGVLGTVSALAIQTSSEVLLGLVIFLPFIGLFRGLFHLVVFAHCNALCKPVALGGHGTRRQQRLRRTCSHAFHGLDLVGRHHAYLVDNHCASHGYPPCCPRARKRASQRAA